jgi:hypothetical protein
MKVLNRVKRVKGGEREKGLIAVARGLTMRGTDSPLYN